MKLIIIEGPDASIHGSILDEQTGELVGSDMENSNAIKVREHGFTNATDQTWYITNTGEYRNNMVLLPLMMFVLKMGILSI